MNKFFKTILRFVTTAILIVCFMLSSVSCAINDDVASGGSSDGHELDEIFDRVDGEDDGEDSSGFVSEDSSDGDEPDETVNYIDGKKISFLGDSITTFEGYNNNTAYNSTIGGNAVWYNASKLKVEDTYWKKLVDELNLELIVNNSWSGSRCTGNTSSAASTRATQLHNDDGTEPNVVVVYMGINDYDAGIRAGSYNNVDDIYDSDTKSYIGDLTQFAQAYATTIHKIKQRYDKADVYVCNLLPNNVNKNYSLLSLYNEYIEKIAIEFGCNTVDFYNKSGINESNLSIYTFDGLHPNENGHSLMTECLKSKILENYKQR